MKISSVHAKIEKPQGVEAFISKLNNILKSNYISAEAVAGGSYAKSTYLNSPDIDVFVRFNMSYKNQDISKILQKALTPFKPEVVHGSRDYYKIGKFEVVPVLKIKDVKEAANIMDVSFFHIEWVNKHISMLHDDIRLAKLFCQSANIYGAESHISGFSGYILELLTIYYGGFDELIQSISNWGKKTVVDPADHYAGKNPLKILNKAKIQSPLVVVDPVMEDRNAAASVSLRSYSAFVLASKRYLSKKGKDFFRHHETGLFSAKKDSFFRGTKLLAVKVVPLEGKEDVVGSKLLKSFEYIKKQFGLYEFRVFDSGWSFEGFWFELYEDKLPRYMRHKGPPIWVRGSDEFLKKHDRVVVDDGHLVAIIKRKFPSAKDLLKKLLKDKEVAERVKSVK